MLTEKDREVMHQVGYYIEEVHEETYFFYKKETDYFNLRICLELYPDQSNECTKEDLGFPPYFPGEKVDFKPEEINALKTIYKNHGLEIPESLREN